MEEVKFMQIAIEEAKKADFPFGAVIVKNNKVISSSGTGKKDGIDPTEHAEINAIRKACEKLNSKKLPGATLYSTCEPCPMCFAAAWWADIENIVFSITLQDSVGLSGIDEIDIPNSFLNEKGNSKINIKGSFMKDEIIKLFKK